MISPTGMGLDHRTFWRPRLERPGKPGPFDEILTTETRNLGFARSIPGSEPRLVDDCSALIPAAEKGLLRPVMTPLVFWLVTRPVDLGLLARPVAFLSRFLVESVTHRSPDTDSSSIPVSGRRSPPVPESSFPVFAPEQWRLRPSGEVGRLATR